MRKPILLCAAAMATGCGTFPYPANPPPAEPVQESPEAYGARVNQRLNAGLTRLYGLPIQNAIAFLGYPDAQQVIAGDTVYRWNNLVTIPGYGQFPSVQISCAIQIGTDRDALVKNTHVDGQVGACAKFANDFPAPQN